MTIISQRYAQHYGKNIEGAVYISKKEKGTKIKIYRNWMTKVVSGDDKSKFYFRTESFAGR